jgi:hypothetical protein
MDLFPEGIVRVAGEEEKDDCAQGARDAISIPGLGKESVKIAISNEKNKGPLAFGGGTYTLSGDICSLRRSRAAETRGAGSRQLPC